MAGLPLTILAILASLAALPQFIFTNVYANGPVHNADHTLGQFAIMLLMPLGIAIVVFGLLAMRAR